MRRPRGWACLLVLLMVTSACSGSHRGSSATHQQANGDGASPAQLAAADLAPCPSSSGGGGSLPDITLRCLGSGPAVHLAGLRGPAVVNIWGSWCPPCQKEIPYFTAAYDADKSRVAFLGIDTEDESDSALNFATKVRPAMHYPSVVDENKKVLLSLDQPGPPATVFIDAAGRSAYVLHESITSTAELQHDIATYLHVRV